MQKPLCGPALSEAIRDYIKEYILQHKLKPGDPLPPEPQLMEELRVGRSSVREAIKALQSLGIVDIRRGNGHSVRETNFDAILEILTFSMRFDPFMFAQLFQIRVWLETAVIEDAVRQMTDSDMSELAALLAEWQGRLETNDPFADMDQRFHAILYQSLKNHTLSMLLDVFWGAFESMDIRGIRDADPEQAFNDHVDIYEAIKIRDTELIRERLIDHFSFVQERLQRGIAAIEA